MYYLTQPQKKMMKRNYSKVELVIRAFIFSVYSLSTMIPYSFLCLLSLPFPLWMRWKLIRGYLRAYFFMLEKICHLNYKIEGLENIPKQRAGIILSKHQSTWETFILPLIFHEPAIILKRELFWVPFFGWGLAMSDPIAIDRKNKTTAMQQIIVKGKKRLDEGRWILVFPEGTRVPPGVVGHYRLGGARLATETGYPVIPVAHNAGRFWGRRQFTKQPGTITMVIGPLIETEGRTPEEVLKLAKDWIESTVSRIDSFVDKPPRE